MLRGPTVTVLSPRRCQEMRGKRIKMFVVIAKDRGRDKVAVDEKEVKDQPTKSTTTSTIITNDQEELRNNDIKLCRCEQFKKTLATLCRRVATVPRSVLSSSRNSTSSLIGHDRDRRLVSRFIFYAKVTILTELFGFLRGIGYSWRQLQGGVEEMTCQSRGRDCDQIKPGTGIVNKWQYYYFTDHTGFIFGGGHFIWGHLPCCSLFGVQCPLERYIVIVPKE